MILIGRGLDLGAVKEEAERKLKDAEAKRKGRRKERLTEGSITIPV